MAEAKTARQELIEAMEAYATSKGTDDACLQRIAMVHLAGILKRVTIEPVVTPEVRRAAEEALAKPAPVEEKKPARKTKSSRAKTK